METTSFYHDDPRSQLINMDSLKKLKSNMTLDFDASTKSRLVARGKFLLASPDINLLKLASPELERMLIQQSGSITTTPTPTQFIFPRSVTEEQEAYARGFVDALEELHKQQGIPYKDESAMDTDGGSPITYTTLCSRVPSSSNLPTALRDGVASLKSRLPLSIEQDNVDSQDLTQRANTPLLLHLKEEPQTVPCMGMTPPLSPINMESQERIKLERKRARNRVAARKCRTRKLERISRLEDRVGELKRQNVGLSDTAGTLREQVCRLKQQIMDHVQSGCQMMDSHTEDLL